MNKYLPVLAGVLLVVLVSGCGTNPEVSAAEQVVAQSESAAAQALDGKGSVAEVQQYFATPLEGGNIDTNIPAHIAYSAPLVKPSTGYVQLSNLTFNGVNIDLQKGEARVMYQVDITITGRSGKNTATVSQNLLLVKTPSRGWRIVAGDGPQVAGSGDNTFLGNLLQQ